MAATNVGAASNPVQDAVAMWALKQTMALTKTQLAQAVTTAPVAQEPGKGTLLDVKL